MYSLTGDKNMVDKLFLTCKNSNKLKNNKNNYTICSLCGNPCKSNLAHLHQGKYIGDECCWDERLRTSE